jgi:hypothetical protein
VRIHRSALAAFAALVLSPAIARADEEPASAPRAASPAPSGGPVQTQLVAVEVQQHPRTAVHFLSYRGEQHHYVEAQRRGCTTPCTLMLRPGATIVNARGAGTISMQIVVPHLEGQVRISAGAPGYYVPFGATMLSSGFVTAAAMWTLGFACRYDSGCAAFNFVGWPVFGVGMMVIGSIFLGLGGRTPPLDANRVEILDASHRPRMRFTGIAMGALPSGAAGAVGFVF